LSISDEQLLLTSKITEGKKNTRTTTDKLISHSLRLNQLKRKEDIKSVKISAEDE